MVLIIVFTAGASIFTIRVQLYGAAIHFDRWGSILKVPDIYYSHRNPKVIVPIVIYNENPYCVVGWNKTREVVIAPARRDHRTSKFGLRHGIELIEIYAMTNSEF